MTETKRDSAVVGPEWMVYWALRGDEPEECIAKNLSDAMGDPETHGFLLTLLSDAFDPNGTSEFRLKLIRRKRGKPTNKLDRAIKGHGAAGMVESAVSQGVKQEAAIAAAEERYGLSRAEIFAWLKHDRAAAARRVARASIALPTRSPDNSSNCQD